MPNLTTSHSTLIKKTSGQQTRITNFDSKTAALHGDLSIVTIENLMQLMSHASLSGELHLVTGDNAACFIIRNGSLVYGYLQFNLPRIGERLVQAGHISIENLKECLRFYQEKGSKLRLGEILVGRNFVSNDTLEEVIREQVKDSFFKALSWREGTFSFRANESPPEEDIQLEARIDHLIMEGVVAIANGFN